MYIKESIEYIKIHLLYYLKKVINKFIKDRSEKKESDDGVIFREVFNYNKYNMPYVLQIMIDGSVSVQFDNNTDVSDTEIEMGIGKFVTENIEEIKKNADLRF